MESLKSTSVKVIFGTLVVLVLAIDLVSSSEGPCAMGASSQDPVWQRDPNDCTTAYLCLFGRMMNYTCPQGYVIGAGDTGCVKKGSEYDDCTVNNKQSRALEFEFCKVGERVSDNNNCGKYQECIETSDGKTEMVERECDYPMLFDTQSLKCDTYHIVTCDSKQFIPKSQCDYDAFQCEQAHCVPCNIRFPSCTGLPDGINTWVGREWSPYYVICEDERVIYQGECSSSKVTQVFHPENKACVVFDETTH